MADNSIARVQRNMMKEMDKMLYRRQFPDTMRMR